MAGKRGLQQVSRVGSRRQIVIPKDIFERVGLRAGDEVDITVTAGRLSVKPRRHTVRDDVLSASEAKKVRHAMKQIAAGKTRPWNQVKGELGL
jgi:AbrB family looped-hinge helix DNA binding protein